jgi:hypothetical protein
MYSKTALQVNNLLSCEPFDFGFWIADCRENCIAACRAASAALRSGEAPWRESAIVGIGFILKDNSEFVPMESRCGWEYLFVKRKEFHEETWKLRLRNLPAVASSTSRSRTRAADSLPKSPGDIDWGFPVPERSLDLQSPTLTAI